MTEEGLRRLRVAALAIARSAVAAADPRESVTRVVSATAEYLSVGGWRRRWAEIGRIIVIGAGKASTQMASALEDVLGSKITSGVVITKDGHGVPLRYLTGLEAGHPVPDERGVAASTEVLAQVNALSDRDVVFVLLSGGGSSLLLAPTEGLTLFDKQATTGALLACGATIQEINCVRKHLSRVKGGQLAKACAPADVLSLVLSDVIGDPLDVIASGPTVPDPTIFADALAILERYGIRDHLPASVVRYVEAGVKGEKPETPKHEDSVFERSHIELVGTNRIALQAAEEEALRRGYTPHILTSTLRGEAREAAKVICALVEGMPYGSGSSALILGGETTVTLSGKSGRGGRNQELALAAARELQGRHDVVLVSLGTDGTDGPTDAAGGLVDGTTWERGQRSGLNLEQALREHDAYPQLKALGDLVVTGPTGTNVMDIVVALVGSGTTV